MVVEEKLQPDEEEAASDRVTRSWLLASLVIGELLALAVIAGGLSPSKGVGGLVAMSISWRHSSLRYQSSAVSFKKVGAVASG